MKKLISLALAVVMVLSMSVTAFAAETDENTGGKDTVTDKTADKKVTIDVKGIYETYLKSPTIISADVLWESMNFTYADAQQGTWNVKTHKYDGAKTGAGWVKNTSTITIKNHSNAPIMATLSYKQDLDSVTGSFDSNPLTLVSAAQDDYMGVNADKAPTESSIFTIDGSMSSTEQNGQLGTITVSIAENKSNSDGGNTGNAEVATEAAFLAALENGGNITLMGDFDVTENVRVEKRTTLNLNGHTITFAANKWISVDSELILNDTVGSGQIVGSNYYSSFMAVSNAKLTIEGGTVSNGYASGACLVIQSTGYTSEDVSKVVMNGGNVGTVQVKADNYALPEDEPQLVINGGSYDGIQTNVTKGHVVIQLNGGSCEGELDLNTGSTTWTNCITITGGTYPFDPTEYVDTDNYEVVESGGSYTVQAK